MRSARFAAGVVWLMALVSGCGGARTRASRHLTTSPVRAAALPAASTAGQPVEPSFSRGACVAFSPTSAPRRLTVFLDAGHGGRDPGAVGSTESGQSIDEARLALGVELDTMTMLRATVSALSSLAPAIVPCCASHPTTPRGQR